MNAAEGDRFDRRPRQATDDVAQQRFPPPPVDRHSLAGVDHREGIGAAVPRPPCDVGDARHIRRQLGDDRQPGHAADPGDDTPAGCGIAPQIDAVADVRTGDVELEGGDPRHPLEAVGHLDELALVGPRDAHDHRSGTAEEEGELMAEEGIDAVVVEADRVEKPRGGLDRPPGDVAGPGERRDRLRDNPPEPGQIDKIDHLFGIPEGPRRHEDRIREAETTELDRQVDRSPVGRAGGRDVRHGLRQEDGAGRDGGGMQERGGEWGPWSLAATARHRPASGEEKKVRVESSLPVVTVDHPHTVGKRRPAPTHRDVDISACQS